MRAVLRVVGVATVAVAIAGCGQQGPLYLPDKQPDAVLTPAEPAQAPAAATSAADAPQGAAPATASPADTTTPRTSRDPARTPR